MKRENADVTYGLPLESIVGGRYLIQKVRRVQEDQIVYLAADLVEKKQVELIEYFPQELVTRNGAGGEENVTVLPGGQEKLQQQIRQFEKEYDNTVRDHHTVYAVSEVRNGNGGKKPVGTIMLCMAVILVGIVLFIQVCFGRKANLQTASEDSSYQYIDVKDYENKDVKALCEQIEMDYNKVLKPMLDSDGVMENDPTVLKQNAKTIYTFAEELKDAGIIQEDAYCESGESVTILMPDDSMLTYFPSIKDSWSDGDTPFCVTAVDMCDLNTKKSAAILDNYYKDKYKDKGISTYGFGAKDGAEIVEKNVSEYTMLKGVTHSSDLQQVKEYFKNLGNNKVRFMLWRGHGGIAYNLKTGRDEIALLLGDGFWFDWSSDEYKSDREKGYLMRSEKLGYSTIAIMPGFIDAYMGNVEDAAFLCGVCYGFKNDTLKESLEKKGFSAYLAMSDSVEIWYSDFFIATMAGKLCYTYESGEYIDFLEAYEETKKDVGASDNHGVYAKAWVKDEKNPFRLVPRTAVKGTVLVDKDVTVDDIYLRLMSTHSNARVVVQDDYSFIIPITDTTKQYDVACEIKRNKVKEISLTMIEKYKIVDIGTIDLRTGNTEKTENKVVTEDEETKKTSTVKVEAKNLFEQYLQSTLIPQYGRMSTDSWQLSTSLETWEKGDDSPMDGILSALIQDLDGDGQEEMLVVRFTPGDEGRMYLEVYEANGQNVGLQDEVAFDTSDYCKYRWDARLTVFVKEYQGETSLYLYAYDDSGNDFTDETIQQLRYRDNSLKISKYWHFETKWDRSVWLESGTVKDADCNRRQLISWQEEGWYDESHIKEVQTQEKTLGSDDNVDTSTAEYQEELNTLLAEMYADLQSETGLTFKRCADTDMVNGMIAHTLIWSGRDLFYNHGEDDSTYVAALDNQYRDDKNTIVPFDYTEIVRK